MRVHDYAHSDRSDKKYEAIYQHYVEKYPPTMML